MVRIMGSFIPGGLRQAVGWFGWWWRGLRWSELLCGCLRMFARVCMRVRVFYVGTCFLHFFFLSAGF